MVQWFYIVYSPDALAPVSTQSLACDSTFSRCEQSLCACAVDCYLKDHFALVTAEIEKYWKKRGEKEKNADAFPHSFGSIMKISKSHSGLVLSYLFSVVRAYNNPTLLILFDASLGESNQEQLELVHGRVDAKCSSLCCTQNLKLSLQLFFFLSFTIILQLVLQLSAT